MVFEKKKKNFYMHFYCNKLFQKYFMTGCKNSNQIVLVNVHILSIFSFSLMANIKKIKIYKN